MLIQDRIKMIMKSGNLSASDFAAKIDVKRSNLSHILSGRNNPSLDFLAKVIEAYPKVNASWLITGETREGDFQGNTNTDTTSPAREPKATEQIHVQSNNKRLKKIVLIYEDDTFDELHPNAQ